ncbi:hypothetical protein PZA11_000226 [Diplocarpon coronariae]
MFEFVRRCLAFTFKSAPANESHRVIQKPLRGPQKYSIGNFFQASTSKHPPSQQFLYPFDKSSRSSLSSSPDLHPHHTMAEEQELLNRVRAYVEEYMNKFDGSHDFSHIKRVVGLAHVIFKGIAASATDGDTSSTKPLDPTIITLAAMLHDVGDRKYLKKGQDPTTQVQALLLSFDADVKLAAKVQAICRKYTLLHTFQLLPALWAMYRSVSDQRSERV